MDSADGSEAGGTYSTTSMVDIDIQTLREAMAINFESNFCKSSLHYEKTRS
jgi:hypothetical protein